MDNKITKILKILAVVLKINLALILLVLICYGDLTLFLILLSTLIGSDRSDTLASIFVHFIQIPTAFIVPTLLFFLSLFLILYFLISKLIFKIKVVDSLKNFKLTINTTFNFFKRHPFLFILCCLQLIIILFVISDLLILWSS